LAVHLNVTLITVVLEVNMKNIEWGKCLCKCYISDCDSQSKYEKYWARQSNIKKEEQLHILKFSFKFYHDYIISIIIIIIYFFDSRTRYPQETIVFHARFHHLLEVNVFICSSTAYAYGSAYCIYIEHMGFRFVIPNGCPFDDTGSFVTWVEEDSFSLSLSSCSFVI
jgi:hypothetical protein